MSTNFYTPRGIKKALLKIDEVKTELSEHKLRMGDAIDHGASGGDSWHDNAAFDAVTNDMRMTNHRLLAMMATARGDKDIVPRPTNASRIDIGINVIFRLDNDDLTLSIGGFGESDLDEGIIAYNTPLGEALCGMRPGDEKEAVINGNKRTLKVYSISVDAKFWNR